MKRLTKFIASLLLLLVIGYYGSAFILPSITLVNNSGYVIEQAEVSLPSSNLNFGSLQNGEENTLHYALNQTDGTYNYHIKVKEMSEFEGNCGSVTNNEIHKRIVILINQNNKIICH